MAFASWRQISNHTAPDGTWCPWSLVSVREGAALPGCIDGCPDSQVELIEDEVPWPDSRLVGDDIPDVARPVGAVA